MLDFAIFAVTFVVALIVAVIYLYPGSKRVTTIPGMDPSDPKDGNLADINKVGSFHEFLLDLHDTYGDIASFWMGEQLIVSIASPELFKQHNKVFDRPSEIFIVLEPLIGRDSIQFANGSDGRQRRQIYDSSFGHQMVGSFFDIFNEVADGLAKKWETMSAKEEHIPLHSHMLALAIKIICRTSFGEMAKDEKQVLEFRHNYDICWRHLEIGSTGKFPPSNSQEANNFEKAKKSMYEFIKNIVDKRKKAPPSESGQKAMIDAILEGNFSENEILSDVLTYIIGGFHTSGNLLTWAFYFLASHQNYQEKLYKEIANKLGSDKQLSPDNITDLPYLRQVIDETLRCAVLAPYAARFQEFDSELGGHVVPKNTPVVHALGVVLKDERIWPQPDSFDPERFSDENTRDVHSFEPYGFAGKRKCPGYRFAYSEVSVVLASLLQKFKVELIEGQVVTPIYSLVCKPEDEIYITVSKRE